MAEILIDSVSAPFDRPDLARAAFDVLTRSNAMGLLDDGKEAQAITVLGAETMKRVLIRVRKERIAQEPIAHALALLDRKKSAPKAVSDLTELLAMTSDALEHSPVPRWEWHRVAKVLDSDLLIQLLRISASSLARYSSGDRATPDDVAARLHFVAMTVADLQGAYNDVGVRRWFGRKRSKLDGKAPMDLLGGRWNPADDGPVRVRGLAHALTGSPAT